MPFQSPSRERRVAVATGIAQCVKGAVDIRQNDTLAIDRDKFHLACRQVACLGNRYKPVRN